MKTTNPNGFVYIVRFNNIRSIVVSKQDKESIKKVASEWLQTNPENVNVTKLN